MGATNSEFQGSVYYHGSPASFKPGDTILPPNATGKAASAAPDKVYASKDHHVASYMAWEQNNFNGSNFDETKKPSENVYRVTPIDPTEELGSHSSLSDIPRLDLESGRGPARDVTSTTGFRVLSQVQYPKEIDERTTLKANELAKRSYNKKIGWPDERRLTRQREMAIEAAKKKKTNKELTNAARKSRRFTPGNVSTA